MYIRDMFKEKRPTISFEIFPPKTDYSLENIYKTIGELKDLNPDFISVTYGAGGTTKDTTVEIASKIKNEFNIETIAHLTCVRSSEKEINNVLNQLRENNIENILALRGDIPDELRDDPNWNPEFKYAGELIDKIKENNGFSIGGACYPETHMEARNAVEDLRYLKAKCDKGLDFLITQLFLDNELFYQFKEKTEILGIDTPIIAGIMPITKKSQLSKIQELSGSNIPPKFLRMVNKYEHNPEALKEAGIAYATEQIIDLLTAGVDGIHIYTMNKSFATRKIMNNILSIRESLLK